jgi:membrane-associated phospholipid phosphatase
MRSLFALLIFTLSSVISAQNGNDTLNSHKAEYDSTVISKATKRQTENLFKKDSVFSFRSPKGYFPSLFNNISEQASAPFHFKTKQWLFVGASVVVTAALFTVDEPIDEWAKVQKTNHKWVAKVSPNISRLGDDIGIYSILAFGLTNAFLKNEKGFQTSLLATQAILTSAIRVRSLKLLTGRERPLETYAPNRSENSRWYGPFAMIDQDLQTRLGPASFDSFPSGHTSEAFAIATVFAIQYKDIKAVPIISYSLASLVGISRLIEHEHWASDVFVGALIGWASGKQVTSSFNKLHSGKNTLNHTSSRIKPEFNIIQNGNTVGLTMTF